MQIREGTIYTRSVEYTSRFESSCLHQNAYIGEQEISIQFIYIQNCIRDTELYQRYRTVSEIQNCIREKLLIKLFKKCSNG